MCSIVRSPRSITSLPALDDQRVVQGVRSRVPTLSPVRTLATFVLAAAALASACHETGRPETDHERVVREQVKPGKDATPPPRAVARKAHGIWISRDELLRLPTRGAAWERMKATADGKLERPDIADMESKHDAQTLAIALVYARTGDSSYRRKAADAIASAVGTEQGGRTLELGRNLLSYVVAADLIDFRAYEPAREAEFRKWLRAVRHEPLGPRAGTLVRTAERSPSNWGGMAGASRVAVAAYLGDERDIARAAKVMKGWLGDRSAYPGIPWRQFGPEDFGKGFQFGGSENDLSWQADPSRPVGVNPKGVEKDGHSIDGALPDDMRRGGSFTWPPHYTQYPREALDGYVTLAELLYRQGYDVYAWDDKALLRATRFLFELGQEFPDESWWEPGVPAYWIINYRYGTSFPVGANELGRPIRWTDWTHSMKGARAAP